MSYAVWEPNETGLVQRADGSYGNTFLDGRKLSDELKKVIQNMKDESVERVQELTHKIQELQRVLDEHVNK